ncbi:hypothetical protein ACMFMG_005712 [Clarireedia jacksonii]
MNNQEIRQPPQVHQDMTTIPLEQEEPPTLQVLQPVYIPPFLIAFILIVTFAQTLHLSPTDFYFLSQRPINEPMTTTQIRGGRGEAGGICCGLCAGLACFECCELCC